MRVLRQQAATVPSRISPGKYTRHDQSCQLIPFSICRRRSPKKLGGCKARLSSPEAAEEKLNQEAFRLARTIRNLLHTSQQQPDLSRSLAGGGGGAVAGAAAGGGAGHRLCKTQLLAQPLDAAPISPASKSNGNNTPTPSAAEMLFMRANTMRDSRLSLRSSTDSSVHSTISSTASSSSKIETDEEITAIMTPNGNNNNNNANKQSKPAGNHNGSSTEDESGFSSISSFHDVGLPLSSTLIADCSSRNSTLKSALNGVGVPLPTSGNGNGSSLTPSQSPAKTYRNASRYQRFSTLTSEDAAAVLWV